MLFYRSATDDNGSEADVTTRCGDSGLLKSYRELQCKFDRVHEVRVKPCVEARRRSPAALVMSEAVTESKLPQPERERLRLRGLKLRAQTGSGDV